MDPNDPNQGLPYPPPAQAPYIPPGETTKGVRAAGWMLAVIGPLLVVGTVVMLGTTHLYGIHIVLFTLVGLFGLNSVIGGIRMISTGRRSKVTMWLALGLFAMMIGVAREIYSSDEDHGGHGKPNMARMAEKIGRGLPRMIDSETRWDSVAAGPADTLTYNYTMVHYTVRELDRQALSAFLADSRKKICAMPDMQEMLKAGSVMEFKWSGKDKSSIAELHLAEDTCR